MSFKFYWLIKHRNSYKIPNKLFINNKKSDSLHNFNTTLNDQDIFLDFLTVSIEFLKDISFVLTLHYITQLYLLVQ